MAAVFLGASGVLAVTNIANTSGYGAWQLLKGAAAIAPSGTIAAYIEAYNTATSGVSRFDEMRVTRQASLDNEVVDGTTYGRTAQSDLYSSGGVNRVGLRIAGSGQRIGDQRNLVQRTVTNVAAKVPTVISYSASAGTPATATISIAAFTVLAGSVSTAYSAMSASTTGTNGTTITYYLYFDDPSFAGGTQTLVATTNSNDCYAGDGRVYAGSIAVTYPTSGSGSGSGGGGGTGCPQVDEPVTRRAPDGSHEIIRAGDVHVGDYLLLTTGRWGWVSYAEAKLQPCVHVTGEDGSTITCSTSAPLETDDGTCVPAPSVDGLMLRHRESGVMRIDDVAEIGDAWVQHITCEDACFWVGMYSHHNSKPP